jgi:hypothetical protein
LRFNSYSFFYLCPTGIFAVKHNKNEKGMPCKSATVPAAVSSYKTSSNTFATVVYSPREGRKQGEQVRRPACRCLIFAFGIKGDGFIQRHEIPKHLIIL